MRRAAVIGATLLLAACAPAPPLPAPRVFVSPPAVRAAAVHRVYLPLWLQPANKLGIAGGNADMARALGASWYYAWRAQPDATGQAEAVPMLWGRAQARESLGGNAPYALLFNEPDRADQAAMTPGEAAVLTWQAAAANPGVKWGCPAVSQAGLKWLDQYFDVYECLYNAPPPCAFLTAHCYYATAAACIDFFEREFKSRLDRWRVPGGVWVTEVYMRTEADARALRAWLDATPWITRYSPFVSHIPCSAAAGDWDCAAVGDPSLFTADGALTRVGRWWHAEEWIP